MDLLLAITIWAAATWGLCLILLRRTTPRVSPGRRSACGCVGMLDTPAHRARPRKRGTTRRRA